MKTLVLVATHKQNNCSNLIEEMKKFGDVVVLIDEKQETKSEGVEYFLCENKGYDFGKFYNFYQANKERAFSYDQIIQTNETIIPIKPFDKLLSRSQKRTADFCWAIDWYSCENNNPKHRGYHLQSFFHIFNKPAEAITYYLRAGIISDKFDGVRKFETFFTAEMMEAKGRTVDSFIKSEDLAREHGLYRLNTLMATIGRTEYDKDGELNLAFNNPDLLMEHTDLPFVKNSCFQYHHRPRQFLQDLVHQCYEISSTI